MIVKQRTKTRKGLQILSLVADPGEPVRKVVLNQFLGNHSALPLVSSPSSVARLKML